MNDLEEQILVYSLVSKKKEIVHVSQLLNVYGLRTKARKIRYIRWARATL